MSGEHDIGRLCEALMVSRSGYYGWLRRRAAPGKRATENAVLRQRIRDSFERSHRRYGSPRIPTGKSLVAGEPKFGRLRRYGHGRI